MTKIKYWKIGTNVYSYIDVVKKWIDDKELMNQMVSRNQFVILVENKHGKQEKEIRVNFLCDKNKIVYRSKNNTSNTYSHSTIMQFIRSLQSFNILEKYENTSNYKFTNKFIDEIMKDIDSKTIHSKLNEFLLDSIMSLFTKYNDSLEECVETKSNVSLIFENNSDFSFTRSLFYHIDEIEEVLNNESESELKNFNEVRKLYDNVGNYFGGILQAIFANINKSFHSKKIVKINSIIQSIIYNICKIFSIPSEKSKLILQQQNELIYYGAEFIDEKCNNDFQSEMLSINKLLEIFLDKKIIIPIYQRDYVWDITLIKNLISSLNDDLMQNNNSYLNNIILLDTKGSSLEIVDGQQRIFSIMLILFGLFKIAQNDQFQINHKILLDLFLDKNYKDLYLNIGETNIYNDFSNLIDDAKQMEGKYISSLLRQIVDELLGILKTRNQENFSKLIVHILNNTFVTKTTLNKTSPEIIFRNLNQNIKALTALDLLRNFIFSKCKNNEWKNSDAEQTIKDFNNKIVKHFLKKENGKEIDYKKLENFSIVLYNREKGNQWNIENYNKSNKELFIFNILEDTLIFWEQTWKKDVNSIFDRFIENIEKYEYIIDTKKQDGAKYPIVEIPALSSQIYAAISGKMRNTIFVPLIWKLLDKFGAFEWTNANNKNESLTELSKWLFEIERFNIFWKILSFRGQSLTGAIENINNKLFNDENEVKNEDICIFRKNLLRMISELHNIENKNEKLKEKLDEYKENPTAINDWMKFLLLNRINYALDHTNNGTINNSNLYIISNETSKNKQFNQWHNNCDFEHCLAKKNESKENLNDEQKMFFEKKTSLIGNGAILDSSINKGIKNKNIEDKINEYEKAPQNNHILHGKDNLLLGFNDLKSSLDNLGEENIDKLKTIYDWIDERTNQMNDIIVKMYSYEEE